MIDKMAEQCVLVLSDVLCFAINNYVKVPVKQLKSILVDFYTVESLSAAKVRLLHDIEEFKTSVKFPHVPQRRDGENRAAREVDVIVTLLHCLDENKLLNSLPTYMAANPDHMPSSRLFEGDMNVIITMLEKMQRRFVEYGSALAAITSDVSALKSKFMSFEQSKCIAPDQFSPLQSTINTVAPVARQSGSQPQSHPGVSSTTTDNQSAENVPNWAVLSSIPYAHPNRFNVLRSTADDENSDAADRTDSYTAVQSRRGKCRACSSAIIDKPTRSTAGQTAAAAT